MRNPFRLSFDTKTGMLIVGDIGQNDIEEVDVIVKGGNYGWNHKEGTLCFDNKGIMPGVATTTCPPTLPPGLIEPIAQFDTHHEGHSVIGGFVYRGSSDPRAQGPLRVRRVVAAVRLSRTGPTTTGGCSTSPRPT